MASTSNLGCNMKFPDFFPTPDDEDMDDEAPLSLFAEDVPLPDELPSEEALLGWFGQLAAREGKPLVALTYIFCSDEYLLQVNIDYLQHDYYTDIITFQTTENALHGDMYISVDRVRDNAAQLGVSFRHELLRVMVHGALHLAGYGDKTDEQERTMREKEDVYLGICPAEG
jgi:probable rRNA maturation factor